MDKRAARLRRAKKTRERIKARARETGIARLSVHRTPRHIYAQVISTEGGKILACASSLEADFKKAQEAEAEGGKVGVAKIVGKLVAERAIKVGVKQVAFDRSGFKFHGRVAALAQAAKDNGLMI
ncbi:MAG: 50S ribosomal protein L18 [Gammaproteobacteria bacterium]